jgi:hypothetical protein
MRYCPHCHRFNPGSPLICHFCGCTWYVRLCPRGHENPPSAQYCGACGSTDLSETAGRKPWLLIIFKVFLWFLIGLLVYSILGSLGNVSTNHIVCRMFSLAIAPCLLLLGLSFLLSFLPAPIGQSVRSMMKYVLRLLGLAIWGLLKSMWRILR